MLSKLIAKESFNKKPSCEDSAFFVETEDYIYGAVCDGCSNSLNSAFASQLLCYLWKKHASIGSEITDFKILNLIEDLKSMEDFLHIDKMHLLATFIPFYYSKTERVLRIRPFGDGVYYVDGSEFRLEQDNTPDYIGYQVNESFAGHKMYMDKYSERVYRDVDSFVISTDGIDSFSVSQFVEGVNPNDVYKLLEPPSSSNYLQRTYNVLKNRKFNHADDLGIISYVKN